jgi:uncharacterized protein
MKTLNSIVLAILIIGAINWGSIGLFNIDLVATIFGGATSMLSKIIYILVGISGLWAFSFFKKLDED